MEKVKSKILQLLDGNDIWLSANNIAKNLGYSGGYMRDQCKELVEGNFLEVDAGTGGPFYRITDDGRAYLEERNDE